MLINEIFDKPYELDPASPTALSIRDEMKAEYSDARSLRAFQVVEDPTQFIITFTRDGIFEVHHMKVQDEYLQSGKILTPVRNRAFAANPRYISTAIKLYLVELARGHAIRIVANPNSGMWQAYERIIKRYAATHRYDIGELVDYIGIDGEKYIARVIKPRGKFTEMLQNIRIA